MGFDLSAKLFYGFKLVARPDTSQDTIDYVRDDCWEDEIVRYAVGQNAHWQVSAPIRDAIPCMISYAGWSDSGYDVLGIRSTFHVADNGELKAISLPAIDPAWDDQLREWCEKYGFEYGTPSWQLVALYW